ncbi:hypothetical protein CRENBAI_010423 [Crenichthys baileyi]|uniref:Uncharacterized protein n=1 Tax=Crenichthys baileyi TaxID=28760 RepID=A0AAV9QS07_9TELE
MQGTEPHDPATPPPPTPQPKPVNRSLQWPRGRTKPQQQDRPEPSRGYTREPPTRQAPAHSRNPEGPNAAELAKALWQEPGDYIMPPRSQHALHSVCVCVLRPQQPSVNRGQGFPLEILKDEGALTEQPGNE